MNTKPEGDGSNDSNTDSLGQLPSDTLTEQDQLVHYRQVEARIKAAESRGISAWSAEDDIQAYAGFALDPSFTYYGEVIWDLEIQLSQLLPPLEQIIAIAAGRARTPQPECPWDEVEDYGLTWKWFLAEVDRLARETAAFDSIEQAKVLELVAKSRRVLWERNELYRRLENEFEQVWMRDFSDLTDRVESLWIRAEWLVKLLAQLRGS
jgi:hypothetical protein